MLACIMMTLTIINVDASTMLLSLDGYYLVEIEYNARIRGIERVFSAHHTLP